MSDEQVAELFLGKQGFQIDQGDESLAIKERAAGSRALVDDYVLLDADLAEDVLANEPVAMVDMPFADEARVWL